MKRFKTQYAHLVLMLILSVFMSSGAGYGSLALAATAPVDLGAAAPFGVFGSSFGMTNQGLLTVVNGNIGTTGAASLVTGFHDTSAAPVYTETGSNAGFVNGTIYTATTPLGSVAGETATAVALAAQTAYINLSPAALPNGTIRPADNLGSLTLAPGVYTSASGSFIIQGGDLTLDALGDPNAVWVFQMSSTLLVGGPGAAAPQSIILAGGAQAKNVFWQVGSTATINAGGGGTMMGTIIASAGVAVSTPGNVAIVTINGRALALNASVTLVNTVINVPAAASLQPASVTSAVPVNAAAAVAIGNKLSVTFSGAMDPATISTATFSLKQGAVDVPGTVTYSGVTAVFTPASYLAPATPYTATITTGAKGLGGNALARDFVWSFTTGAATDTLNPTVSSTIPANAGTAAPTGSKLTATFSEAMDPATISSTTFTLNDGVKDVSGTVAYSGVTAIFTPASALASGAVYTATITTGATDLGGNAVASNYAWSFTTGLGPDIIKPAVTAINPADLATGVAVGSKLTATLSEAMDPLTITTETFTLQQGVTAVAGTVNYSGVTAVFTPMSALAANTVYTATITTGVMDLAGNVMASNYVWSFTTEALVPATGVIVTTSFLSPQLKGASITFTAAGQGTSGSYDYKFMVRPNTTAAYTLAQNYGNGNSFVWDTTNLTAGDYTIAVYVKNSGSSTTSEAVRYTGFTVNAFLPATGVTVTTSFPSPQVKGSSVVFSAVGQGTSGSYDYKFMIRPNTTAAYTLAQNYGSGNSFVWDTTNLTAGDYTIAAYVKNSGSSATTEAVRYTGFTVSSFLPATGVIVTTSFPSPQLKGASIAFTAAGQGTSGSYDYKFMIRPNTTAAYTVAQNYGNGNSFIWDTTSLTAGDYTIAVYVKNSGSAATSEAVRYYGFTVNAFLPATGVTVTTSLPSPQVKGSSVVFSAVGQGTSGSYDYKFMIRPNTTAAYTLAQNYGNGNSFVWDTSNLTAGDYTIAVYVKNSGSSMTSEAVRYTGFTVE